MTDIDMFDDSPIFWELVTKYGRRFNESPWSPEYLETPWPTTFTAALEYMTRTVAAQDATMALPILTLDRYAQAVDLDATAIQEIIEGVLVDG